MIIARRYSIEYRNIPTYIFYKIDYSMVLERNYGKYNIGFTMNVQKMENNLEKIMQDKSDQLDEMLKSQQLMITNISHEIRTSLNAISGYLYFIDKKDTLSYEDKIYLEKANQATSTLRSLVSDILDISKINTGQMEIKEESFWLDELILKCIDSIALKLNKKNITFKVDADILPCKLTGDHHHILGILVNLLSNAVKYTDNGFVHFIVKKELCSEEEKIKLIFQVEDSGIGMTLEQLKKIFEPYTRFKVEKEGVGLGLHIASKMADKLGGDLTVKSRISEGSTFNFTMTVKKDNVSPVSMHGKVLCFFNNLKETKVSEQKRDFLKQFGAKIIYFSEEEAFTDYLLTVKDDIPDIISISTYPEGYTKFDALIHYLKNIVKFQKIHFIAEGMQTLLPLEHFDKIYERFTPISAYINVLRVSDVHQDRTMPFSENKIRILAVDDLETNLEILSLFITNKYPKVFLDLAMGGYEAIGMYKTQVYDIILMDLKMPGLNGFEVFEKFKSIKSPPPTYALTADVYKDTYERVMYAGFTGLLEKPLQVDLMFKAIEKVLHEKNN